MHLRQTRTYVEMELSPSSYDEIAQKMREADYGHAFLSGVFGGAIDMHGLAIVRAAEESAIVAGSVTLSPDTAKLGVVRVDGQTASVK